MGRKRREYWLPDMAWTEHPQDDIPRQGTVAYAEYRSVRALLEGIASRHGTTLGDMLVSWPGRRGGSMARDEAYYELRQLGFAWPETSRIMGAASRSTGRFAAERHWRRLQAGRMAA